MTELTERIHRLLNGSTEQNRAENRRRQGIVRDYREVLAAGVPIPVDPATVWMVDLAGTWNGVPDYVKLKARGCRGVIIKAADGTLTAKLLYENVKAARAAGIQYVAVYFWAYRIARISASTQAAAWWNIVKGLQLDGYWADYEWTSWNGQPDNPTWKDLQPILDAFEQISGKRIGIYSAPGYLSQYPIVLGTRLLWIANYNVLKPNTSLPWWLWQCSETWPGDELGFNPLDSKAEDGNVCSMTAAAFDAAYGGAVVTPPEPDVIVIERSLADYALCFTQGTGELPLLSAVEHAAANGWECAMNGGAGFDYTDATHAIPRSAGFQAVNGIPYARRMLTDSVINPALWDNGSVAPWTILAFRDNAVALIVARGLDGGPGMTQVDAAQYVKSLGYKQAYLMDSGHSSQVEENGEMLYWPYGPSEKVPQAIGFKKKQIGGSMVKGVCRAGMIANIKNVQTGAILHQMTGLECVYGEWSAAHTDLIGFTHYYSIAGERRELAASCKVSVGNLLITENVTEPGTITPPPPDSTAPTVHVELNDNGVVWAGDVTLAKK